ncbi:MAG TPA: MFS transporter [Phycisphaerae bacterium]|nr:MFS transporter [Phycisphaerae bacterium]
MTDGPLNSDITPSLDTSGLPITPSRLRRAMVVNMVVGTMGAMWFTVCGPQQILSVFYKNALGSTPGELGNMISLVQFSSVFNLVAIFIYSRTRTRKHWWVAAHVVHRLFGFVLAAVAVYAAQGGDRGWGAKVIMAAMVASWVLTTSAASGWWSWMADLVPEGIRATFFGRRATVVRAVNMAWFFGAAFALDEIRVVSVFYVYAAIFALGGLLGLLDIIIHAFIPEPARGPDVPRVGWAEFTEPLRNRNFLTFSLAIGAWSFSTSVLGPFIAPYITAADGIGAPMKWLSINALVVQITMIATGTAWGIVMDRFGRKPAVILGALHPLPIWIGVFFMTPTNYPFILVSTALVAGLLAAGFWDGSGQLMLTLTPQRNRNAYLSWHMATVGTIAAGGSYLGGWMGDTLQGFHYELWSGFVIGGFHVVAGVSFVLSILSTLTLYRIREGSEKPVGFVVSRLLNPGIFRTFLNLRVITSAASSVRTVRALRGLGGATGHLAVADVMPRLHDPDAEVRDEAARALGRIGSDDAVDVLIAHLADPDSTIRPAAAQALGRIGDPKAIPALKEGLRDPLPEVRQACEAALASFGKPRRAERALHDLRTAEDDADTADVATIIARLDDADGEVREEAARALGRIGATDGVSALVRRLHDPTSTIRPVIARSLGQIGDARAVPALTEALSGGSDELQDAAAHALGAIGNTAARQSLQSLLDEPRAERVFASGAEALSKLGILEAAMDIVPRMHDTPNPVLRRQMAIAMGNLLGRPGQFYAILTAETASQGVRLGSLFRGARRATESFRPVTDVAGRMCIKEIQADLGRLRSLMEHESYPPAIAALAAHLRSLVRMVIGRDCADEVALEYAFGKDAKLGLGFWFVQEIRRRAATTGDPQLLYTDALLALYFLSVYRLPPQPRRPLTGPT